MLYNLRKTLLQILPIWTFIRIWASNQDPRFRTLSKGLMRVSPMIIDSIDVFSSCWRVPNYFTILITLYWRPCNLADPSGTGFLLLVDEVSFNSAFFPLNKYSHLNLFAKTFFIQLLNQFFCKSLFRFVMPHKWVWIISHPFDNFLRYSSSIFTRNKFTEDAEIAAIIPNIL